MFGNMMGYFGGRKDPKASAREAIVGLRQQLQMLEKKEEYTQKKIDEELKKAKSNAVSNKQSALVLASLIWLAADIFVSVRSSLTRLIWKFENPMHCPKKRLVLSCYQPLTVATQALRRKKQLETELDKLSGMRLQLESQIMTLESANINAETLAAMKKGSEALKSIHGNMYRLYFPILEFDWCLALPCIADRTIDKVDATMAAITEQREIAEEISQAISNPLNAGIDLDDVSNLL
jgi:charged multivesicular body protein 4A/B